MNKYPNLALAIETVYEAKVDAFLAELEPEPDITLSLRTERKLTKLVKRRDKSYYPLVCTAGRRIACVFAFIIVFAVSAMSIKPVRAAVVGFFTDVFSTHTHMTTTRDTIPVNSGNFVEYEITVPEGFELVEKNIVSNYVYKLYNSGEKYIIYNQISKDLYSANYDNERSIIENYTNDDGVSFNIIETDNNFIVIWENLNYVYNIKSNLSKNEILDLCNHTNIAE